MGHRIRPRGKGVSALDSLTHLVMGHAMGTLASGATPAIQLGAYWGALVGNSLPDIDVPVGYLLRRGWAFHRKFTHTIPGLLGLSGLAAGVITAAVPGSSFAANLSWTLAGGIVHLFLDCLNMFGVRPFRPFSDRIFGAGVLFILDPVILGGLTAGSLLHAAGLISLRYMQVLYLLTWLYVAGRWIVKRRLAAALGGPGVVRAQVIPHLSGWRYLRETKGQLEYGFARALTGQPRQIESIPQDHGPAVQASRTHPQVQAFLQRARYPYARAEQTESGYRVIWQDLYQHLRGLRAGVEVLLDHQLQPQSSP